MYTYFSIVDKYLHVENRNKHTIENINTSQFMSATNI